jgi:haloalkane dehalogenase
MNNYTILQLTPAYKQKNKLVKILFNLSSFYLKVFIITCTLLLASCKPKKNVETEVLSNAFFNSQDYNFLKVGDSLKMAYLDLGNFEDPIVLLMHGEPNNSFVYRNIAPAIVKKGYRVIIPDLIGFGYSKKLNNSELITYANQTKWLTNFIQELELTEINLFAHDWGAMISLRIVAENPKLFKKVAISYGYLFEGSETIPESFLGFKDYAKNNPAFSAGDIMNWGSYTELSDSLKTKYDDPFYGTNFIAARRMPWLIPSNPLDNEGKLNKKLNIKLQKFNKPFITIWGNHNDPMWNGKDSILQNTIPGAKNQKHFVLESNHFIQEDKPYELSQILIDFFKIEENI